MKLMSIRKIELLPTFLYYMLHLDSCDLESKPKGPKRISSDQCQRLIKTFIIDSSFVAMVSNVRCLSFEAKFEIILKNSISLQYIYY